MIVGKYLILGVWIAQIYKYFPFLPNLRLQKRNAGTPFRNQGSYGISGYKMLEVYDKQQVYFDIDHSILYFPSYYNFTRIWRGGEQGYERCRNLSGFQSKAIVHWGYIQERHIRLREYR